MMRTYRVGFTQLVSIVGGNDNVPMVDEAEITLDGSCGLLEAFDEFCCDNAVRVVPGSITVELLREWR